MRDGPSSRPGADHQFACGVDVCDDPGPAANNSPTAIHAVILAVILNGIAPPNCDCSGCFSLKAAISLRQSRPAPVFGLQLFTGPSTMMRRTTPCHGRIRARPGRESHAFFPDTPPAPLRWVVPVTRSGGCRAHGMDKAPRRARLAGQPVYWRAHDLRRDDALHPHARRE